MKSKTMNLRKFQDFTKLRSINCKPEFSKKIDKQKQRTRASFPKNNDIVDQNSLSKCNKILLKNSFNKDRQIFSPIHNNFINKNNSLQKNYLGAQYLKKYIDPQFQSKNNKNKIQEVKRNYSQNNQHAVSKNSKKQEKFIQSIDDYISQLDSNGNLKQRQQITLNQHQNQAFNQIQSRNKGKSKQSNEKKHQSNQNRFFSKEKKQNHCQNKNKKLQQLQQQIQQEKNMNHTLQKSVIEFQKILLNRNQKLQRLQKKITKQLRSNKENSSHFLNLMDKSTKKVRENNKSQINKYLNHNNTSKINNLSRLMDPFLESDSYENDFQSANDSSIKQQSSRVLTQQSGDQYQNKKPKKYHQKQYFDFKRRRKTELSTQLQKIIQKTLASKQISFGNKKSNKNRSQRQNNLRLLNKFI